MLSRITSIAPVYLQRNAHLSTLIGTSAADMSDRAESAELSPLMGLEQHGISYKVVK
jgi:hypothetical protein